MRTWILGGCLATVAAGGVYFVATGGDSPTHCGPCVSCSTLEPAESSNSPAVVEVVDVAAALAKPAAPPERPFVSFDEPPLAKALVDRAPDVIQAAFGELHPTAEVAPLPRPATQPNFLIWTYTLPAVEVAPTPRSADPMPLASSENPF